MKILRKQLKLRAKILLRYRFKTPLSLTVDVFFNPTQFEYNGHIDKILRLKIENLHKCLSRLTYFTSNSPSLQIALISHSTDK